ncbi:MAG TPA: hypothetical protein VGT44_16720 [Ktedonobacteraceae bacterium]|nr:hypothetical protein [Ktedonobacteraceae bacterium]
MSTVTPESKPIKTNIAPWLLVSRATEAVDFYKAAFGAVELYRLEDDAGKVVVAQLAIEGADFWLQEDVDSSPEAQGCQSVRMILTVADPDSVFEQSRRSKGIQCCFRGSRLAHRTHRRPVWSSLGDW